MYHEASPTAQYRIYALYVDLDAWPAGRATQNPIHCPWGEKNGPCTSSVRREVSSSDHRSPRKQVDSYLAIFVQQIDLLWVNEDHYPLLFVSLSSVSA